MKRALVLILVFSALFVASFTITISIMSQWREKTIGTPECNQYTSDGAKCYELKCKFTSPDSPTNYDSCETV